MDKPDDKPKPQPPVTEIVILRNIQVAVEASLKELQEQGKTQKIMEHELRDQGVTLEGINAAAHESVVLLSQSLKVQQDSRDLLQKIVDELSEPLPEEHIYKIDVFMFDLRTLKLIPKEGSDMAVEPGKGRAFGANMQDNGNNIPLPESSSFAWTTDNTADQIAVSADTQVAVITVPADSSGRSSVTVTASAVDPDGNMISGNVTVPIIPGVGHTFTISVAELQVNPLPGKSHGQAAPKK